MGTDPNNADTDGDGFDDDIELTSGTDPLNPNDYPLVNQSCDIDSSPDTSLGDLLLLQRHLSGLANLDSQQVASCDLNDDGELSITDLLILQQTLLAN